MPARLRIVEAWALATYVVLSTHWRSSPRSNLRLLRRAVQAAVSSGDFQMAGMAVAVVVSLTFHSGFDLGRVDGECAAAERLIKTTAQPMVWTGILPYRDTIRALQTPLTRSACPSADPEGGGRAAVPRQPWWGLTVHPMRIVAPFLLGDRVEAARQLRTMPDVLKIRGLRTTTAAPWFTFYASLITVQMVEQSSADGRDALWADAEEKHRAIEAWALRCPENFAHRSALVAAEMARVDGRAEEALPLYDLAVSGAHAQKALHEEAVAYELAGRCWLQVTSLSGGHASAKRPGRICPLGRHRQGGGSGPRVRGVAGLSNDAAPGRGRGGHGRDGPRPAEPAQGRRDLSGEVSSTGCWRS